MALDLSGTASKAAFHRSSRCCTGLVGFFGRCCLGSCGCLFGRGVSPGHSSDLGWVRDVEGFLEPRGFVGARVGSCAELSQVGVGADGLEVREEYCEGSVGPEDFVRVAPKVDVALLGPQLEDVGLCRLQRLVDYVLQDMLVRVLPWPPPALLSQRYLGPVSVWEERA